MGWCPHNNSIRPTTWPDQCFDDSFGLWLTHSWVSCNVIAAISPNYSLRIIFSLLLKPQSKCRLRVLRQRSCFTDVWVQALDANYNSTLNLENNTPVSSDLRQCLTGVLDTPYPSELRVSLFSTVGNATLERSWRRNTENNYEINAPSHITVTRGWRTWWLIRSRPLHEPSTGSEALHIRTYTVIMKEST